MGPRKANSYDVDQQVYRLRVNYVSDSNHFPSQQIQYLLGLDKYEGDFNVPMSKKDMVCLLSESIAIIEGHYQVAFSWKTGAYFENNYDQV